MTDFELVPSQPSARVVAVTTPLDFPGGVREFIAYVARVSNPANQMNHETSPKLIAYLQKKGHWSPFEMANMVVEIKTTRDIAHQIIRHRSFSFQEFSQRYAEVTAFTTSDARRQDLKNRQGSIDDMSDADRDWWYDQQMKVITASAKAYHAALGRGIAKEVARKVLPEGLTLTTLYMNGTVRSWIHYLHWRLLPEQGAQKEHRDVAEAIYNALQQHAEEMFTTEVVRGSN